MRSRLTKIAAALAGVAALAVGGSAIAGAAQKSSPSKPAVSQSQEPSTPGDKDNVQQGDQSAPDNSASESAGESADETAGEAAGESAAESGASDGPGGYADSPANADTQQQGEN